MIQIFFFSALYISAINKKYIFIFLFLISSITLSNNLFAQDQGEEVKIVIPAGSKVIRIDKKINERVYPGDSLAIFKNSIGEKILLKSGVSGNLIFWELELSKEYSSDETVGIIKIGKVFSEEITNRKSILCLD